MKYLKIFSVFFAISLISLQAQSTEESCQLPPKGPYFTFWKTCTNVKMDGCTLHATCEVGNSSNKREATFDMSKFNQCPENWGNRNLTNNFGKLCCNWAGQKAMCGN